MARLRSVLFIALSTFACSGAPPETTVQRPPEAVAPYEDVPPSTPAVEQPSDFQRRQDVIRRFEGALGGGVTYESPPVDGNTRAAPARFNGRPMDLADDVNLDGVWTARLKKGSMSKIVSGPGEELTLKDRAGNLYSRHEAEIQVFRVQGATRDWLLFAWTDARAIVKRGPLLRQGAYRFELSGDTLREHAHANGLHDIDARATSVLTWTRRPEPPVR